MEQFDLDKEDQLGIMTPKEVAEFMHMSQSWVYKNWQILGGRKLKGSLFFPTRRDLYEHIFGKGAGVEVRLPPGAKTLHKQVLRHRSQGQTSRGSEKGENSKSGTTGDSNPNRHGLFDIAQRAVGSRESL
jgi:hypothetical protein